MVLSNGDGAWKETRILEQAALAGFLDAYSVAPRRFGRLLPDKWFRPNDLLS